MALNFEELDYQQTSLGDLMLRRRDAVEADGREIFEVKLGDDYLMSSLFYDGEVALTNLGLAAVAGDGWDVVVGGLGLGYTAATVLKYDQVTSLTIVEALRPVIEWHQRDLVPNGAALTNDSRCRYHHADFFACSRGDGFDPHEEGRQFDAILLDIDHTPDALLNPSHADFYTEEGMKRLRRYLKPAGVFALWSNDEPEESFLAVLRNVFDEADGHIVEFPNPIQGGAATNGVYVAKVGT